ncbi:hypothetical protein ECG_07669 [Echinococcus granulosus]|uniref:Expressed protein n=1 Tax=Echinococcus granulosus TaxID=6210 RepID=A0A068WRL8_ECHGR|nr:hypothetical protein ECG_07669 [Echinococcus granulosus]CDS22460.1 expressed protein [Echinococcus granulosus]
MSIAVFPSKPDLRPLEPLKTPHHEDLASRDVSFDKKVHHFIIKLAYLRVILIPAVAIGITVREGGRSDDNANDDIDLHRW